MRSIRPAQAPPTTETLRCLSSFARSRAFFLDSFSLYRLAFEIAKSRNIPTTIPVLDLGGPSGPDQRSGVGPLPLPEWRVRRWRRGLGEPLSLFETSHFATHPVRILEVETDHRTKSLDVTG